MTLAAGAHSQDVKNTQELASLVGRIAAACDGRIDIVVNNAGIAPKFTIEGTSPEVILFRACHPQHARSASDALLQAFAEVMTVNAMAPAAVLHAAWSPTPSSMVLAHEAHYDTF